ncbi:MAG TPA: SsrA-binding protein SmpB [Spirochaetota bacterium]|nr:SsrA-binding protein SmpB [Spirochaetota bacterium]
MSKKVSEEKIITKNRKAFHDFNILQRMEAGIALTGTEVKSTKDGKISLKEGFCHLREGEIWLKNVHISQYPYGNRINHDPLRERKLLLHKGEITKLGTKLREKGLTLVPLSVYVKRGKVKVELGLVSGKRQYDKREEIRKKDESRELGKDFKLSNLTGKLK